MSRFPDVKECSFTRTINARRLLKMSAPEGFLSHLVVIAGPAMAVEDLKTASLASLAQKLRRSMQERDEYYLRSLLTSGRNSPDKTTLSYGVCMKSGLDMVNSSFVDLGLLHSEFEGVLGKALFARRPRLDDAEGVTYLMPKTIDGDVDVAASLRVEDVKKLRRDPEWMRFVEYIG